MGLLGFFVILIPCCGVCVAGGAICMPPDGPALDGSAAPFPSARVGAVLALKA